MYINSNKFQHLLMYRLASLPLHSQPFDFSDVQLETKKRLPLSEVRLPTSGQIEEPAVQIAVHYLVRIQMVRIDVFVALVTKRLLKNVGAVAALYDIVTAAKPFHGESDDTRNFV